MRLEQLKFPKRSEFGFCLKTDGIFEKSRIFQKLLKVPNLPWNATETVKFLETFEIWLFLKKRRWVFREKNKINFFINRRK